MLTPPPPRLRTATLRAVSELQTRGMTRGTTTLSRDGLADA